MYFIMVHIVDLGPLFVVCMSLMGRDGMEDEQRREEEK